MVDKEECTGFVEGFGYDNTSCYWCGVDRTKHP